MPRFRIRSPTYWTLWIRQSQCRFTEKTWQTRLQIATIASSFKLMCRLWIQTTPHPRWKRLSQPCYAAIFTQQRLKRKLARGRWASSRKSTSIQSMIGSAPIFHKSISLMRFRQTLNTMLKYWKLECTSVQRHKLWIKKTVLSATLMLMDCKHVRKQRKLWLKQTASKCTKSCRLQISTQMFSMSSIRLSTWCNTDLMSTWT